MASDPDARGTLVRNHRDDLMIQGLSIFSVASDTPVTREEILEKFSQQQVETNRPGVVAPNAQTLADMGAQGTPKRELPVFIRELAKIPGRMAKYLAGFIAGEQRNKKE